MARILCSGLDVSLIIGLAGLGLACVDRSVEQLEESGGEPERAAAVSPGREPASAEPGSVTAVDFVDLAVASGVEFSHVNGRNGSFHMAELMGAGVALLDLENDGDLDLYLIQGGPLPGMSGAPEELPSDRLYRNDTREPDLPVFVDVTPGSGFAGAVSYGMGAATGDVDNDGFTDLYLTALGADQLWRNRGDGTFEDVTARYGLANGSWGVPATFADFDRDGWLDLFVGNYLTYAAESAPVCADTSGRRDYCGAALFPGQGNRLWRNLGAAGDLGFGDVTRQSGLAVAEPQRTLGALAADLDDDGWLDLFVANDAGPNRLWRNQTDGTFREDGALAGVAVNDRGQEEASMGVDAADIDRDGDFDLIATHLVIETHTLYQNQGNGLFTDRTAASGLGPPSRLHTGFGASFFDANGDGWLDLFVANGAVQHIAGLVRREDPLPIHELDQLFLHRGEPGEARYGELPQEETISGQGRFPGSSAVSRGVAVGDLDNDGDLDLVVTVNGSPARLWINRRSPRPWIGLRLVTGERRRDALGARVDLQLRQGSRRDRVASDGSYGSAGDPRLVFTLEHPDDLIAIEVLWPDGIHETWPALALGRYHVLVRGSGTEQG